MNLNELNLDDVPEVKSVERLSLGPNDTLVLKCDSDLTEDNAQLLRRQMERIFPGHKVIILGEGMDLQVIREE